jgi:hypothetical protein
MQDSCVSPWAEESHLSVKTLGSLRDLNYRFLDLAGAAGATWTGRYGLPADIGAQLAALSRAQRTAAADCPYALFDLRFQDDAHWRARLESEPWRVADDAGGEEAQRELARLIVFYAWHVASLGMSAQLLLGMRAETVDGFRRLTVDSLPALALSEAKHLSARWQQSAAYWSTLIHAACGEDAAALRRAQLYGLQLAAAARLT